jgi:hypothetical protein
MILYFVRATGSTGGTASHQPKISENKGLPDVLIDGEKRHKELGRTFDSIFVLLTNVQSHFAFIDHV